MTWLIVVIAIVLVLAAAAAYKWNRSAALRQRFGPEYERILAQEGGDQRRADAALRDRAKRRAALRVRDLTADAHTRFGERWHALQGHFVDDPRGAVNEAAQLVRSVMYERGYHADDPDMADGPDAAVYDELDFVAVDHPEAANSFRAADETARDGSASTEDLRQAFQGYKALFVALLVKGDEPDEAPTFPVVTPTGDEPDRVIDVRQHRDGETAETEAEDDAEAADARAAEIEADRARADAEAAEAARTAEAADADGDGHGGGLLGRFRRQPADADTQIR